MFNVPLMILKLHAHNIQLLDPLLLQLLLLDLLLHHANGIAKQHPLHQLLLLHAQILDLL
jgi:hypothetical protein